MEYGHWTVVACKAKRIGFFSRALSLSLLLLNRLSESSNDVIEIVIRTCTTTTKSGG